MFQFHDGPKLMGIVNVTPDSFSDGGQYNTVGAAVAHAIQLVKDGADILDIGGESTRPYSTIVPQEEEIGRVIPVIERLTTMTDVPISIDTSKPEVARRAIDAGAEIINDVAGLRDPKMKEIAADTGVGVCAMHMLGTPQEMQDDPQYDDVVEDIFAYLADTRNSLIDCGIESEKICLDPGIGFGKTHEHNITLLKNCRRFTDLGSPILIGHSRKGFVGKLLNDKSIDRDPATATIAIHLLLNKMSVIRVHNVKLVRQMLDVFRTFC